MEQNYWQEIKCCNEMRRLLENKARQKIVSDIEVEFESGSLSIYGWTATSKLVSVLIATYEKEYFFKFKFMPFNHSEPLIEYLEDISRDARDDELDRKTFRYYVIAALTDFIRLHGQRFN